MLACIFSIVLLPIACTKAIEQEVADNEVFDVAAAKEWWYGSFRKSDAFERVNVSSPFYIMSRNTAGAPANALSNDYVLPQPSWNRGAFYKVGKLEMVDLPLLAAHRVIPIPQKHGETTTDQQRVSDASMVRLLLVPKTKGQVAVRVVTVIPSLGYLKRNGYELPFHNLKDLPSNFEGIVTVKAWDETEIVSWRYTGSGRSRTKVGVPPKLVNKTNNLAAVPCPPYYGIIGQHEWCIFAGEASDDEPDPCDLPFNWQVVYEYGWIIPEGTCDDGSGNGDSCPNLSAEQCACLTYGLGCDNGVVEDGYDDNINDSLKIPCLINSLKLVAGTKTINSAIGDMLNRMFGTSPYLNVTFRENFNLPVDIVGNARVVSRTNERLDVVVKLNANILPFSSQEYVVATILHEALHAINQASGIDSLIRGDHIDLAVMVQDIKLSLLQIFPNMPLSDAEALAWGGLEGSGPVHYGKLSPSIQQVFQAINTAHHNGKQTGTGTLCK